ncbi:MAG TPA: type II secretion system F family protein [Opitutus sp.]|nr:type II secretion system F family protein [Opitutus sp.]
MPSFAYTAIEAATGRERSGTVDSASAEQAAADLKARGLAPMTLAVATAGATKPPAKGPRGGARPGRAGGKAASPAAAKSKGIVIGRPVSAKGLALFTRQLATLVKAGMPLLRSIEVLARQQKSALFRRVLEEVAETIRSGGNFSDGLQAHPRVFDRLYVNMVRAGEAGGVLDTVLERLARFMEKAEKIKGKVKSAMMYPVIVILLAAGIVAALMVFVVPKFEQIFSGLLKGQPLPALTRAVLGVSNFVKHNIVVSLGLVAVAYVAFLLFRRTRVGTRALDWLAIHVPVLGDLFLKAAIARFTRTFGTLLSSGVPILQALTITRDTSGNVWVAEAIDVVHDRVKEGDNIAGPLEATAIFPGMVTSMIDVGEETGALPDMLTRIAETYDEEVDNAVAALTSLIEPLMIVFLAFVVGTIVIALFLPIVSIIQHLQ